MVIWLAVPAALALAAAPADPFAGYLEAEFPPADGFDVPVEAGAGTGSPVLAIGHGRVVEVANGRAVLEHLVYEGADRRLVRSTYAPLLEVELKAGQQVARRQRLGRAAGRLRLEVHPDAAAPAPDPDPAGFIRRRRRLFVPQEERVLVLVDLASYRMRVLERGKVREDVEIGLGQGGGGKERRGDLKTPRGMYFVTHRSRGPFEGAYADFYGGHWIKVSYPGPVDAERGVREGLITEDQRRRIEQAWEARALTDQRTPLGGGIGFHGWAGEWEGPRARLSWGCVVLHMRDVARVFDAIPVGAMVVLR